MNINHLSFRTLSVALGALTLLSTIHYPLSTFAQGTAFTYQGSARRYRGRCHRNLLSDVSATLRFGQLWQTPAAGPVTMIPHGAGHNGLFTVTLYFGAGFSTARTGGWISARARMAAVPFLALSPDRN